MLKAEAVVTVPKFCVGLVEAETAFPNRGCDPKAVEVVVATSGDEGVIETLEDPNNGLLVSEDDGELNKD